MKKMKPKQLNYTLGKGSQQRLIGIMFATLIGAVTVTGLMYYSGVTDGTPFGYCAGILVANTTMLIGMKSLEKV